MRRPGYSKDIKTYWCDSHLLASVFYEHNWHPQLRKCNFFGLLLFLPHQIIRWSVKDFFSNWPSTNHWSVNVLGFPYSSAPKDGGWPNDQPAMVNREFPFPCAAQELESIVQLTNSRPTRDGQRWSVEEFPQRQSHWPMGGRRSDRWW